MVTVSFCRLRRRFISYFTKEVRQLIAELFKQNRFQQGAAAQQKAWEDWNRRREQAEAEGREFSEPPPTLKTNRNRQ